MKYLIFLAAGMFAIGCDNYVIAGLLSGIGITLNASIAATGQGITAFDLAYVISAPVFSILLARKHARVILITGLTLFVLGNLLTLLSINMTTYIASRALAGMGAGLYTPIAVAAATKWVNPNAKGRALSLIWGANSAGAVIGVPAGLLLAHALGWQAAIFLIAGLGFLALAGITAQQSHACVVTASLHRDHIRLRDHRSAFAVICVTLITATGSLGLYTYIVLLQSGAANSATAALSMWSIGGLMGSTVIGYVVDKTGRPKVVMVMILIVLMAAICTLPATRSISVIGLFPYLLWGAMGWAVVAPQQYILISLHPEHGAILAALNSAAIGLGSALGTALGGLAIANGFDACNLPYTVVALLGCALILQLSIMKQSSQEVVPICPVQ